MVSADSGSAGVLPGEYVLDAPFRLPVQESYLRAECGSNDVQQPLSSEASAFDLLRAVIIKREALKAGAAPVRLALNLTDEACGGIDRGATTELKQETSSSAQERLRTAVSATPQRPRSRLVYWLIALALAGALLYFSLRGIEWGGVWRTLARADLRLVSLVAALVTLALFLRALRWRVLLQAQGTVDVSTAFWATAAGYFGNNFLPARAGELVRTMMVSARCGLGKMFVLTTALSERLCDAITLVVISSVVLLTLPIRPGWFDHAAKPFAVIGLAGAVGIAVLPKLEGFWRYLLGLLPISQTLRDKLRHAMEQILIGIRSFHDSGRLFRFLALTMVIWLCDGIGVILGMKALGMSVSLALALLLIAGLGLGSALPSTPGYVGIYQFVAVSVLTPFGFSRTDAIAYILLGQALQYVVITFWGLIGFTRSRRIAQSAAVA